MAIDSNILEPKGKRDAANFRHQGTQDNKTQYPFERVQDQGFESLHVSGRVQLTVFEI